MHCLKNQRFLTLRFFILLTIGTLKLNAAPEVQAYQIPDKDPDVVEKQIKPLLSSSGSIVKDNKEHRLLIIDEPEVQKKISLILTPWSPAPKNVRIQVSSTSLGSIQSNGIEVNGRARSGNVVLQSGRTRNGQINVRANSLRGENDINTSQFILVGSGGKGYIKVAEEVPEITWMRQFLPDKTVLSGAMQWRDIGTQMVVEPTVLPNGLIRVSLTPSFSYLVNDQRSSIELHELATEVTVAEGAEIDLGGANFGNNQEFTRNFFLVHEKSGGSRTVQLKLRATVEDLGPKPKYIE